MDALLQKKAELRAALAEIGREKKKVKRAQDREAKVWVLTPFLKDVVLIMYVLAGYTAEPAARYLAMEAQRRRWPSKSEDDLRTEAEEVFLAFDDVGQLADLTCLENPSHPEAMKVAVKVVEEWRLAQWVWRLNAQQGVAPSTAQVLQRFEQTSSQLPDAVRPPYLGEATEARGRMSAHRFRQRWGGRHGRIRVQEDVPLEERRAKVQMSKMPPLFLDFRARFRARNPGAKSNPDSGP